ncbi:unnamed protein product [Rhizoctonia solani]|uniref:Uncharacterized protein n=1 Tax=Rhizoctonia solani TaxID=456999 RepID=A0A8H3DKI4_9AGAM|nr:unnamed protein product [Rhizoctonia solani]
MQYVHRMPLVCRRMFATSISTKSRGKGDQAPKSSFAERFGSPTQPQAQGSQTLFPTWPGLQSTQASPYPNPLSFRPPPNLVTPGKDSTDESKQTASAATTRRYRRPTRYIQPVQKQRELFSDCIGNASSFVNTSSFEAKVAMEPAAHTLNRWMVAARNNIERFKSMPEPVEHDLESSISSVDPGESVDPSVDVNSTVRHDTPESSKPFSRTSRNPIVTPSGRRMLSTSTTDASACSLLQAGQVGYHASVVDKKSPSHPPFWKLCAIWVLAAASEIRLHPQPVMSGFMRRFCAARYHSSLSNSSLSFFQPAFHPSLLVFSRGYATQRKRGFKRQAHARRETTRPHRSKQKSTSTRKQRREQPNPQHTPKKSPFIHEISPDIDAPCILIPAPTTRTELRNALRYLIQSTDPPIPLPRLIATHTQYPTLQSSESYNLLLAHASRVAPIPYSARIISQLRTSEVVWSRRTEQLVVRAHIQSGQWEEAIQLAEKFWVDGSINRVPLNIFAELLHVVLTKKATMGDIASMADRCWKLFPTGATIDVIDRAPRIAYNIVRLLVSAERHKHALQLAMKLLESLKAPTPSNIRHCRSILCHIIRPPRGRPSAYPFGERRRLFESLLQHNPSLGLTPDPGLTCALLQNLRKRRKRGSVAFHTLLELRARYGPQVEDSAVRRTIARYAIDEENFDLARNMLERERLARLESSKQSQLSRSESEAPWMGQKALPTRSHLEYLRNKGSDNRKFTVTARSLHRKELKLGMRERVHPENVLAAEKRARQWESIHPSRKQRVIRRAVQFTSDSRNKENDT